MSDPSPGAASQRPHYPYETLHQSLDVGPDAPPPRTSSQRSPRRTFLMCLAAFFVLALLLSVWRSFRFSLPLPDFPFKLNGSRAPSCTLQRLLNAASTDAAAYDYGGGCQRFALREMPLAATKCCPDNNRSAVHVFWNSTGRPFGAKQAATVESFLLTQPRCFALWIWTEDDSKLRSDVAAFPALFVSSEDRVRILRYRPHELAVGTPLEGRLDVLDGSDVTATKADILRALILNRFDGIYIDIDSLFLQDLCPLLSIEWAYQWKLFNTLNSAAMRLFPSGRNVNDILRMMGAQYPWYDFNDEIVTPVLQRSYFPHCLFDPEWETEEFIGFFDVEMRDAGWAAKQIDHAFIYHYHNQYDADVIATSRFTRLMEALRQRAEGRDLSGVSGEVGGDGVCA